MQIIVCIKQVPETTELKINPETNTLIREGVPSILNPFDEYAVEEAIRIKEKFGGEVIVMTMGPPQAKDALLRCLAMGCDKAILLSDRKFSGADTFATSFTLAQAIKKMKYDIIFCGKQAIDGDTAQVPSELAEQLGIPQITYVKKLIVEEKKLIAHRETEDGYEVIECKFPILLTAIKGLNEPRLPSIMGIMKAKNKEIRTITANELNVSEESLGLNGSPTYVDRIFTPEQKKTGKIFKEEEDGVRKLVFALKEDSLPKSLFT